MAFYWQKRVLCIFNLAERGAMRVVRSYIDAARVVRADIGAVHSDIGALYCACGYRDIDSVDSRCTVRLRCGLRPARFQQSAPRLRAAPGAPVVPPYTGPPESCG